MAYKSLLTILTAGDPMAATLDAAVQLARREEAHLDVFCLGVDRTQTGYYYVGAMALIQLETLERAQEEAKALAEEARAHLGSQDIRWGVEAAVAQVGGLSALVGLRARFADLVLLPRPYGEGRGVEAEAILESALFDGQAPVLVLPPGGSVERIGRRVVVAWNQSAEALTAVRRALPILRAAEQVNIVIVDPPRHGPERSDPGGALSQLLARHGVRAEVSILARTLPRVSDVLARHVTDKGADLLVMGAYSHSRFAESILGGTTRNLLEQAGVPVFLAR
ncbi:MAG: universal stress protein [Rhodobacteraceae bacterium]|jgi:nucleotide-binding universal stress UspA family protein|nr:universal stress protein [Paracoccaceae bacterium]